MAFLRTLSASILSSGRISSFKICTMKSIQLGPALIWWIWAVSLLVSVGLYKSSTRITWGKSYAEEVASIAKELACALPFLGTCSKSKESNFGYRYLTWLKYPCILSSFASNSPFTWPTTSLEFEKSFTDFPPILWTMAIPINKASYSASLFVAKKSNFKDYSMMTFSGDISTSPIPEPFWFDAPFTYISQAGRRYWEIVPTNFSSMFPTDSNSSIGGSVNSATKSTRTCTFMEVRGMYLISKVDRKSVV